MTALPQGRLAPAASVSAPLSAANARSDFNIGFSGYRFNGDIGAYTVRFRHYDPTPGMCRWLERDPAGYLDGPSLYSYLGRNPMAGTDPYGLFLSDWWRDMGDGFEALRDYWRSPSSPSDWWRDTTEGWGALPLYLDSPLERFGLGVLKGAVGTVIFLVAAAVLPPAAVVTATVGLVLYGGYQLITNWDSLSSGDRWELLGTLVGSFGMFRASGSAGVVATSRMQTGAMSLSRGAQAAASAARNGWNGVRGWFQRRGPACFLAGTLVLTATPALAVPIESITEGAVVASVDPATGDPVPAVVTATPVTLFEGTIYDITVDPGEPGGGDETTVSATGEHPFLVARAGARASALESRADPEAVALVEPLDTRDRTGQDRTGQDRAGHGRWVPASDLAEGDAVRTMSPQGVAGTATVTKIRGRHAVVSVYNLTVEGTSRYLVGACGVVVHNTNGCGADTAIARAYSVAFETTIAKRGIGQRGAHFKDANQSLLNTMRRDPEFARMMDDMGIAAPARLDRSPTGWTWHHVAGRPGVMQLVPRAQHQGGPWQPLLHPNGARGFREWGGDY